MAVNEPVIFQSGFRTINGDDLNSNSAYFNSFTTLAATGTTRATAAQAQSSTINVTSGSANTGILLPPVSTIVTVINSTGNTIKIYPETAAGTIDGGSAGAAVTLTSAHRAATFMPTVKIGSDTWISALVGAVSS